jgi:hypothetical protein
MPVIIIPDFHWGGVCDKMARNLIDLLELCGRLVSGTPLKELALALAGNGSTFDQYLAQAAENAPEGPDRMRQEEIARFFQHDWPLVPREKQIDLVNSLLQAAEAIEGLEEMRKFAQAAKDTKLIAHALARLEHAKQKTAATGIEPAKVPGSTEIIRRMLDFEVEYRLLSGVAHGQSWALMQAAYAIPETLPGPDDAPPTGKQIKPAFACFAGTQGFAAMTKAAWCAVMMFGIDRKRFCEIVDGFYQRFGGEPKGDLYWRVT